MTMNKKIHDKKQKGFTLIEIIAVLVLLGILAAVAVPRFFDLQEQARLKADEAIFGAVQSVATMNFAEGALSPDGHTPVSTAAHIEDGLDGGLPDQCTAAETVITCADGRTITIDEAEVTGTSRAVITKTGTGW